jgi:CheY-like chemotaxis protein/class 3 adenylate cyclase
MNLPDSNDPATKEPPPVSPAGADLPYCRPAAVLVVDLVKHSTRTKEEISWIQRTLQEEFESALGALQLDGVQLKYTGDGYVCTFLGDASVRVIDFINTAIPDLQRKLAVHQQQLRAGLDFGLVHLRQNTITGSQEHFDEPGIRAARLESAAQPGQILCTETVYNIFSPYHQANFGNQRLSIETKDRTLAAYQVVPHDYTAIRQSLFEYLYSRFANSSPSTPDRSCRILLVEDNPALPDMLVRRLKRRQAEVMIAGDGAEGLRLYEHQRFDIVLADLHLPVMDGWEMCRRMLTADPRIVLLVVTADAMPIDLEKAEQWFLDRGGFGYHTKPIDLQELWSEILAGLNPEIADCFRRFPVLSRNPGRLKNRLRGIASEIRGIFTITESADLVVSLVRHKVKHLIAEFLAAVRPGEDILRRAADLRSHLAFLRRLAETSRNAIGQRFDGFLERYTADLCKEHEKLEIALRIEGPAAEALATFPLQKLLLLSTCELIDNAVAALGGAGKIGIDVIYLGTKRRLRLTVKDNGPGIPAEVGQRIFELGFSTKGAGRGFGLHLIREAVTEMQGEVSYLVENGTRFTISVPVRAQSGDDVVDDDGDIPESKDPPAPAQ